MTLNRMQNVWCLIPKLFNAFVLMLLFYLNDLYHAWYPIICLSSSNMNNKMYKPFSQHSNNFSSISDNVWCLKISNKTGLKRKKIFVSLSYCFFTRRSWTVSQFLGHWISLGKKNKTKGESDRAKGHLFLSTNKWQWPSCEPMIISCLSFFLI